jgi:hypothetical protein
MEKEEDLQDDNTAHKSASALLNEITVSLSSKLIFKSCIEYVIEFCNDENYLKRKAALSCLGVFFYF